MRDKSTVLFDLDGTLTDPKLGITSCIQYALKKLSRPVPPMEELTWCIGPPLKESLMQLLETDDSSLGDRAVELYRERFSDTGLYENEVYVGIPDLLEKLLNEGRALYVATSKPHIYAKRIIEHFKLDPFFKSVHGSELDGRRRDKAELINYLLKQEKIRPAECVMIGDRKHDLIGARKNRMNCVGVLYGYGTHAELRGEDPDHIVESPQQLKTLLITKE